MSARRQERFGCPYYASSLRTAERLELGTGQRSTDDDLMERTDEPFMMIISRDYPGFDPEHDPWAIVWPEGRKSG
jgi:hypothetical protein